jgi:protein tyrosine/serine phosphatase
MSTSPVIEVTNFRDFGGYASSHGGRVRRDRLYRSGQLHAVGQAAIEHLLGLDFALIADLRYESERQYAPSPWPEAYFERIHAHGSNRSSEAPHIALLRSEAVDNQAITDFYFRFYTSLPFDSLYRPLFARVLKNLSMLEGRLLVHCAAGKDRTGIIVALIHHCLGVSRADIVADYMRSRGAPGLVDRADFIADEIAERHGRRPPMGVVLKLLDVEEAYIETAFRTIETRCGSVDAYLDEMGIDGETRARMRGLLLES